MNGRLKSSALESSDGNWTISKTNTQNQMQASYDIPRHDREFTRVPTGNSLAKKSQYNRQDRKTGSRNAPVSQVRIDGQRNRSEYSSKRLKTMNQRKRATPRADKSTTNSSAYQSPRANFRNPFPRDVVLRRSDGEYGFTMRQVPSSLYGRRPVSAFTPSSKIPALQCINCVDSGSQADRVGLRRGDYVIEVNGERVTCAPHLYVVHLIRNSGEVLTLKVVEAAEDGRRIPYHPISSQHTSHGVRYAGKVDSNGNSVVPRRTAMDSAYHNRNIHHPDLPLQLTLDSDDLTRPAITTMVVNQTANSRSSSIPLSSAIHQRHPRRPASNDSAVTNIRLSRAADRDRVSYERRRNNNTSITSGSRTDTSGLRRFPSVSSIASLVSQSTLQDTNQRRYPSYVDLHSHRSVATIPEEFEKGTVLKGANRIASSADNLDHIYDMIRPVDIPFDTDEGYIRLSSSVGYVAQDLDKHDNIDFLAMAEKVRQMYLNAKAASQHINPGC